MLHRMPDEGGPQTHHAGGVGTEKGLLEDTTPPPRTANGRNGDGQACIPVRRVVKELDLVAWTMWYTTVGVRANERVQ